MFASVELSFSGTDTPRARDTTRAVWTSAESSGVRPPGRSPTSAFFTVTRCSDVQRRFSSRTPASTACSNVAVSVASSAGPADRRLTSIQHSVGIALTDVPPDAADRERRLWLTRHLQLRDLRDRPAHRLNRVGCAERRIAMAARAGERHAISMAARTRRSHEEPRAVDGDEPIDLPLEGDAEQLPHAAQVAEAFFADVCHKCDRASNLNTAARDRPGHGQKDGQPAAVVADAGARQHAAVASHADI